MYLRPYRMQNVMNAFTAVLLLIPIIMLIFSLVSFTQEGQIRDVSDVLPVKTMGADYTGAAGKCQRQSELGTA